MFNFKKIKVPSGTEQLTIYEKWSVRWMGTDGYFSGNTHEECEFFTSESDAIKFANQLKEAFALTRTYGSHNVSVKKE